MTVVEFFDGVSIHNMVSCLTMRPEKVIFLGERRPMEAQRMVYERFVARHGMDVSFEYRSIQKNSMEKILQELETIVSEEDNCIFDLTGGEDLVLVAMGIVYERHKDDGKIQMHRFNIRTGRINDCDFDGNVPELDMPRVKAEDLISLYGGCIVPQGGDRDIYHWDFSEDFEEDLVEMWRICRENPEIWNAQLNSFAFVAGQSKEPNPLAVLADEGRFMRELKKPYNKWAWDSSILQGLRKKGLIRNLETRDGMIQFTFKNKQIKECLTKAGNLLELIVTHYAHVATEQKTEATVYHDVVTGAYIDWDAEVHDMRDAEKDTVNEIDVILMKGMIPVFISCKNGQVDQNELYKLHTVAERFGGPYAKKVLVSSYFGNENSVSYRHFVQRAKDMGIKIIANVHEMSEKELVNAIKGLWQ